jgi:HEAT repeat protein
MPAQNEIPFQKVIEALLDESKPFPPKLLYRFSDITQEDLSSLKKIWENITQHRKRALLQDLDELASSDTLLDFELLARFSLEDSDPEVRFHAISLLWECASQNLIPVYIKILETDTDPEVSAHAALALGQFVYYGELEEISQDSQRIAEESLLKALKCAQSQLVQRRALESLGFSSREEIPDLINSAYQKKEYEWLASALCAMGHSADSKKWESKILPMLHHQNSLVRTEAVRAAGELELKKARIPLLEMIETNEDEEIIESVIWSLSQIGGEGVREVLEQLVENADDEEMAEFIQDALDNLDFTNGFDYLMFDMDINEIDEDEEDSD